LWYFFINFSYFSLKSEFLWEKYDKDQGWREKLVNVCYNKPGTTFEFINSDGENENVKKILKPNQLFSKGFSFNLSIISYKRGVDVKNTMKTGDSLEISPKSLIIVNSLSELISQLNGAMLIIDYGENQYFSNSIRVFPIISRFLL